LEKDMRENIMSNLFRLLVCVFFIISIGACKTTSLDFHVTN